MADKARQLFSQMKSLRLKPTYVTYNSMIDVFVRSNLMREAWSLFDQMREYGLKPDNFTCSTLIKGIKPQKRQIVNGETFTGRHKEMTKAFGLLD